MAIKKSVRLVDETCKLLHELTITGETNWSGSINQMAEQYKTLISDNMPELSKNEKTALYCSYNGYMPHPDIQQEIDLLPWHIDQSYQYDTQVTDLLGTKEEALKFINKIKSWSKSQKLSAIYMARAYWRQGPIVGVD